MHIHEHQLRYLLKVSIAFIFLWAFFDKLLGLGFSTQSGQAWIDGVSPTAGYLQYAVHGPLAEVFRRLSGLLVVDVLFMTGLLGVGLGLLLPRFTRFSAYTGVVMLMLMYLSAFPPEHHPIIDEHIVYSFALLVLVKKKH